MDWQHMLQSTERICTSSGRVQGMKQNFPRMHRHIDRVPRRPFNLPGNWPVRISSRVLRRASDNDEDLWRIHQELIDQLEERRRAKSKLLSKLGDSPEDTSTSSSSPPRSTGSPSFSSSPPNPPPTPRNPPSSPSSRQEEQEKPRQESAPSTPWRPPSGADSSRSWSPQPSSRSEPSRTSEPRFGSGSRSASEARSESESWSGSESRYRAKSETRYGSESESDSESQRPSRQASSTGRASTSAPTAPSRPSGPRLVPQKPSTVPQPETETTTASPPQDRDVSSNGAGTRPDAQADLRQEAKSEPQKVYNENAMNVVLVGSECAPWSKTGGLGDVMSALPKALSRRGHRVMAIAPRYENYAEGWETGTRIRVRVFDQEQEVGFFHGYIDGVDWVFVDHPCFHGFANNIYGGNRQDITFRCALLCKAALEAVWHVQCGGAAYGDNNLVFIANDWHTALLPVYLQAHYREYNQMQYARSVFIIHNIAHQGRGPMDELAPLEIPDNHRELFRLYDPIGGEHMNIMKAGFITAHRIVAVSHGYAWECQTQEGGWGLDNVLRENNWKLRGIVNGMDYTEWNPASDKFLNSDGYRHYNTDNFEVGKAACKAALQRELGLPEDPSVPVLGFIGRLDYQKGVDLICESFDWLMDQGVQLVMLGSGRDDLENSLRSMESSRHNQCRGWVGFSVPMAHRITAGCDILLMPSRFEPCGLNQLYAMAYGTVPVVHAVGGLRDTVKPYNPYENSGTGWTYEWSSGEGFREAVWNAIYTFRDHKKSFVEVAKRGMEQDLSWDNAAQQYEEVMLAAKYQW